ncbi:hypothetical protein L7F22_066552 [Adiantum nelumboides]|nr:hypothetical protein [Adiantum nelumboides]
MYAKHGLVCEGRNVLDAMPVRNIVTWNSLIAGYADFEPGPEALKCRDQMLSEQISPDAVTLVSCLKSSASTKAITNAQELHIEILLKGLESDLYVGTALVRIYANTGFLLDAHKVFNEMEISNVVTWNVLLAGYIECGSLQQAFEFFKGMKVKAIAPSAITLSCVLEACWNKGYLEKGQKMHTEVIEKGFEGDFYVANVLVNLYAKHGLLADAEHVFDSLPTKSPESWTAMVSGLAAQLEP